MKLSNVLVVCCALAIGTVQGVGAQTVAPGAVSPTLRAVYVPQGLTVDGKLDEGVYAGTPPFDQFIQQDPEEGKPATEKTEIWVFFDDKNFYVAGRMWDSHPERMIANEM